MAKQIMKSKPRADNYEERLTFKGSFEEMVKVSLKDAENKIKSPKKL